jgi:hypothetical protein
VVVEVRAIARRRLTLVHGRPRAFVHDDFRDYGAMVEVYGSVPVTCSSVPERAGLDSRA